MKIALAVLWALVVLLLLGFGLKLLRDFVLVPEQAASLLPGSGSARVEKREIKLYFADEDADALAAEERSVKLGAGASADATKILAELIGGPQSTGLFPTIPDDTRLLDAYKLGDTLVLDFTRELRSNHPGGSTGELLTVYSIVNTMTENMYGVRKVQILVEGEEIETLTGHMDLTEPLPPDTKWMTARPPIEQGA